MTPFDFCVGYLCEATFADRGSPTRTIMFGMLHTLEYAFVGELPEGETPGSLLEGKAAQSEKAAAEIADCTHMLEILLSEPAWSALEGSAQQGGVPRIVTLTTWLVEIIEKKYPRPAGAVVRGHYATLAQAIFTVGLLVRQGWPGLASELVTERQQELAESQGTRETCHR
jgi:hypothetical protein